MSAILYKYTIKVRWKIVAIICIGLSFGSVSTAEEIKKNAVLEKLALCHPVPEYNRFLKKVVISISCAERTLELHEGMLLSLPKYTEVYLLLPHLCLNSIKEWLDDKPFRHQIRFVAYDSEKMTSGRVYLLFRDNPNLEPCDLNNHYFYKQFGTLWAQDLFEVTTDQSGKKILLTPEAHRYYSVTVSRTHKKVVPDNDYLGGLTSIGLEIFKFPLAFKGGNLLFDVVEGRTIVYCGGDTYRTTKTIWTEMHGETPSNRSIDEIIKTMLTADEIVTFCPEIQQPCTMYHLDQAMVLLPNKYVGVARIIDDGPDDPADQKKIVYAKSYLSKLRLQMRKLGYNILDIDMTSHSLLNFRHNANTIPYVDAETNRRILLMPKFISDGESLEKLVAENNKKTFESIGYTVVPIPTKAYNLKGGIHCLVNVIE